ncbi:MAG: glutamylcysteine synthetase, partial [Eubacterium sp.]|nr:glutamylcysteine synthetase [Eubacterium sp.]
MYKDIILKRFIQPLKQQQERYVGVEIELPIVNLNRAPVDFSLVHEMTEHFVKTRGFSEISLDDDGYIYQAKHPETGDTLSFDCSYNTLEFSFCREADIHAVSERFYSYIDTVQSCLQKGNHIVTGLGINPGYHFNHYQPIATGRYQMLYHFLNSYREYGNQMAFHRFPEYGMFSAASQVQLDVTKENVLEAINTFNRLEPVKALLFANSVWDENPDILINRDWLWVNSLHGLNPHNVGILRNEIRTIDDLVEYIASMSMYCVERDGHYLYFKPMTVKDYFRAAEVTGTWHDEEGAHQLTFRGTLELRSVCTQPIAESFASAAFHTGLMEMLPDLTALLEDAALYHQGLTPYVLRELLGRQSIPAFLDKKKLSDFLISVLDLAREGLYRRGYEEAHFLDPLYHRARGLTNPAKEMTGKPLAPFVHAYAKSKAPIPKGIRLDFYH